MTNNISSENTTVDNVDEKVVQEKNIKEDVDVKQDNKKTSKTKQKNVAVFAEGNLYKFGLGELKKGYSILPKEKAEQWIAASRKVRTASPEEVAKYYNV